MAVKKVIDIDLKITQSKIKINKLKEDVQNLDGRTLRYKEAVQKLRLEEQKLASARSALLASNSKIIKSNKEVQASATNMTKTTSKVVDTTGLANASTQELGRTLSDLPYGIQGVGNNISQLGSLFGGLVQKSGGVTAAMKALQVSIMGPLGILLAFQAVTAFIQTDYFKAMLSGGEAAKKLADDQREVNKALDEFGSKQVLVERYYDVLNDVNTAEKERAVAIQELQKLVPNLKDEDFAYGQNLDNVRKIIDDYVLSQASRIEIDKLVELNSKTLSDKAKIDRIKDIEDEEKRTEKIKELIDEQEDYSLTKRVQRGFNPLSGTGGEFVDVAKTNEELEADFQEIANNIDKSAEPILKKIEELRTNLGLDPDKKKKDKKDDTSGVDDSGNLIDLSNQFIIDEESLEETKEVLEQYQEFLDEQVQQEVEREDWRIHNEQRAADERVRIAKAEAEAKKAIRDQNLNNIANGFSLLQSLDDKNKSLQAVGLIGENAVGVAKNIINTRAANAKANLIYGTGTPLAIAAITSNNISSGLGIAASVAATAKGLKALGKSGGVDQSQQQRDLTPRFNLIEGRDSTQVVDAVNTQNDTPIQAYVLENNVTTKQELARKISDTGSI